MNVLKTLESRAEIQNCLLKSLPDTEFAKFAAHLEIAEFALGKVLYSPDETIEYVYFPENMVASVVTNLENGSSVETGIIGKDGVVGVEIVLGEHVSRREVNIQLAGSGFKMKADVFQTFFDRSSISRKQILIFVGMYISQISQNSACLSFHAIEQRLCRWLLTFYDRAQTAELKLTQEFIALMLGVHRPSVSKNANKLQRLGFIKYNRGKITILDPKGLENGACECYRIGKLFQYT